MCWSVCYSIYVDFLCQGYRRSESSDVEIGCKLTFWGRALSSCRPSREVTKGLDKAQILALNSDMIFRGSVDLKALLRGLFLLGVTLTSLLLATPSVVVQQEFREFAFVASNWHLAKAQALP